ncbi:hypothetical protein MRX96_058626 [Rhipicephalus microplus]
MHVRSPHLCPLPPFSPYTTKAGSWPLEVLATQRARSHISKPAQSHGRSPLSTDYSAHHGSRWGARNGSTRTSRRTHPRAASSSSAHNMSKCTRKCPVIDATGSTPQHTLKKLQPAVAREENGDRWKAYTPVSPSTIILQAPRTTIHTPGAVDETLGMRFAALQ